MNDYLSYLEEIYREKLRDHKPVNSYKELLNKKIESDKDYKIYNKKQKDK